MIAAFAVAAAASAVACEVTEERIETERIAALPPEERVMAEQLREKRRQEAIEERRHRELCAARAGGGNPYCGFLTGFVFGEIMR